MSTKALWIVLALATSAEPMQARSLQVEGAAGYLSEWEISGTATEEISPGGAEIRGAVIWKHVGLCSANGPLRRSGEIRARILGSGSAARIEARLSFDDIRCSYSGAFSGRSTGHMDCSDAKGVPLTLSVRPVLE
jgi:hypothetical protein